MFKNIVIGLITCCYMASSMFGEDEWPDNLSEPFDYPTPSPIDIYPADAKVTPCPSAIEIKVVEQEVRTMTNTGYSILITNAKNYSSYQAGVTGGFFKDLYIFDRSNFFWSDYIGKTSGGSYNGYEGIPLQGHYMHRNTKYPTFEEAIQHRDGLATFIYPIRVKGNVPNLGFVSFCEKLSQIDAAGCSVNGTSGPFYLWTLTTPLFNHYYAYPGSYTDLATEKEYDCATVIVIPEENQSCISVEQFNEFKKLRNVHGKPFTRTLKTSPRGKRPLIVGHSLFIKSSVFP